MKKFILFILFAISINFVYCQRTTDTNKLIVRDSAIFNNEALKIAGATNEQYLKRISGRWVNGDLHVYSDITMIGTGATGDPLKVDTTYLKNVFDTIGNEGVLGIANPYTGIAQVQSNTPGAVGVSVVAGENVTFDVTTSSNGGEIVINSGCVQDVQTLSGSTDTLNVSDGVHGFLDISGNTTIRIEPTANCNTGNITVLTDATGYTLTFVGATMKISPYLDSTAGVITTSAAANGLDVYSWWYDGTRIFINGTKAYE